MPSKKKSKPSFQVPEELQTAPQAGWVYRSDEPPPAKGAKGAAKSAASGKTGGRAKRADAPQASAGAIMAPAEHKKPHTDSSKPPAVSKSNSASKSSSGVLDLTAKVLSAGFGTAGGLVLMTTTIFAAPFAFGKRLLRL